VRYFWKSIILFIILLLTIAGCATHGLNYVPTDRRAFARGTIITVGQFENRLGFSDPRQIRFNVYLDQPAQKAVRDAVISELQKAGFQIGESDIVVSGVIHTLCTSAFDATDISFRVEKLPKENILYEKRIRSRFMAADGISDAEGQMVSLRDCIAQFVDDQDARIAMGVLQDKDQEIQYAEAYQQPSKKQEEEEQPETTLVPKGPELMEITSQRWAVIIGISNYKDSRIPSLHYADADAVSFYEWIVSPSGGRIPPSRVKLLINENATVTDIKDALYNWLSQPLEEDVIVIYFAGHGSPQSPDNPENLFLLPYDTDYQNLATTAFPMWDIETALHRFIKARRVIVIADACHSGGVGERFDIARRADRGLKLNPISSALQNLSIVGEGICVISASDDKQFSQEGQQWGEGHGVFTFFLLKGLKGEADYSRDGRVTLGELIPYLSEKVRRATMSAQCPTVAGKFDPALTVGK
jgi:hypothetical protein